MAATAHTSAFTGDINDWALKEYEFGTFGASVGALGNVAFTSAQVFPLLLLTETCDIEKITIRYAAGSTSGTALFHANASGIAAGAGTALTATENLISANIAANTPMDIPFLVANAPQTNLPSGTLISVTAGGTVANLSNMIITIVVRKTPARRDTSTDAQKVDKTKYFYTSRI